ELCSADARALHDLDRVDDRRVEREGLLDADAREGRAHREGRPCLGAVFDREDETFEHLFARVLNSLLLFVGTAALFKLDDVLGDAHRIARADSKLGASLYIDW